MQEHAYGMQIYAFDIAMHTGGHDICQKIVTLIVQQTNRVNSSSVLEPNYLIKNKTFAYMWQRFCPMDII